MKMSKVFKTVFLVSAAVLCGIILSFHFNFIEEQSIEDYSDWGKGAEQEYTVEPEGLDGIEIIPITGSTWSVYRNLKYGFQFEYPSQWVNTNISTVIYPDQSEITVFSFNQKDGNGYLNFSIYRNKNIPEALEIIKRKTPLIESHIQNVSDRAGYIITWPQGGNSYAFEELGNTYIFGQFANPYNDYILDRIFSSLVIF